MVARLRASAFEVCAALIGIAYTGFLLRFIASRCYFFGDDYSAFVISTTKGFYEGLWIHVGGQVVPLTRVVNYVYFELFGIHYAPAVLLLCAVHALGVWYLYRILGISRRSAINAALVALYCSYVYLWVQLGWWSAGVERVPFVTFALMAIYYYLRYFQTRRLGELGWFFACTLLALGFYAKGVLVPACAVGADLARCSASELRARFQRRSLLPWGFALLISAIALAISLFVHAGTGGLSAKPAPAVLWQFETRSLAVFAYSLFGLAYDLIRRDPYSLALWFWLVPLGYTLFRAPHTFFAWATLGLLVSLNVLIIGASSRVGLFGAIMAIESRYYWDVAFIAILFLGLIAHRLPITAPELAWAKGAGRPIVLGLLAVLLAAHAVISYRGFSRTAFALSNSIPETKAFMDNLRADLRRASKQANGPLTFLDGDIPPFVAGLDLRFHKHSQLLALMDVRAEFPAAGAGALKILPNGHVVPARSP